MRYRIGVAIMCGCALSGRNADAQELRVSVGAAESSHELLGSPTSLQGSVGGRIEPWLGVRLGLQYGWDRFTSVGSTCVGLVPPGADCGPEPREERSTTVAVFLSAPLTATFGWGEIGLVPGIRRVAMSSRQEGTTSGRAREADKAAYGVQMGIESELFLLTRPHVGLHLGAYWAAHPWFDEEIVADGYTPFEETTRLRWIQVGMSVSPRR